MLPLTAYAFQFDISLIPVQSYFKLKDSNGVKGF